jgi:hypothetical protein
MKDNELYLGAKVLVPTRKTTGYGIHEFTNRVLRDRYQGEYLQVHGIDDALLDDRTYTLRYPTSFTDKNQAYAIQNYEFRASDLDPYIEPAEEPTPTLQDFRTPDEVKEVPPVTIEEVRIINDNIPIPESGYVDEVCTMSTVAFERDLKDNPFHNPYLGPSTEAPKDVTVEVPVNKAGLRYNEGKEDYTLMDLPSFKPMVDVLAYGAHKYSLFEYVDPNDSTITGGTVRGADISKAEADRLIKQGSLRQLSSGRDNWKLGGPNMTLLKISSSLFRHLAAMLGGEDKDKESGLLHIGHIMCNVMFIGYHMQEHLKKKKQKQATKFDDRFKS